MRTLLASIPVAVLLAACGVDDLPYGSTGAGHGGGGAAGGSGGSVDAGQNDGASCSTSDPCMTASWTGTQCELAHQPDGTPCPGTPVDACNSFACVSGFCQEVPPSCSAVRPVVLVHGVNGSSSNYDTMVQRLIADGWPPEYLFAFDAADPSWGCNVDNAQAIADLVQLAIASTCEPRVDVVAHSMGTLSSRHFVKNLGGSELVNTYVTLGGPHHGLSSPCFAPDFLNICIWQELCESGAFIEQLNAPPATPGSLNWVSIYGTADSTVPNASSFLDGAENIEMAGVEHAGANGLQERQDVYDEVKRVLEYPCW